MPRRQGTRSHTSDEAERELRALGAAIRRERDRRGWTLEAMSEATGLDPAYLARVESGRINITFRSLHRIGAGLGMTTSSLFAGVG
ncbi:MAG: helix-turn-helix transcriptional regulator [Sandaracinaceae bacterium]|nr:helix-turn-helix transcriptional regulator [Sandaracinaceae bacterium]MBK7774690.1 helix-turn-helix transcriptional regulator [Sandaracinaceae bacterium]MBK8410781.1 helix-turn-helix transcriptional regulator [Sandaracinaceae bacterium]